MLFAKPSMVTKALLCVGLCMSSVPAMAQANPCVAGTQGCVLPIPEATAPVVTETVTPVMVEEPKSFGILPILAGLAALGLLAFLLLDDDNEDEGNSVSP